MNEPQSRVPSALGFEVLARSEQNEDIKDERETERERSKTHKKILENDGTEVFAGAPRQRNVSGAVVVFSVITNLNDPPLRGAIF